MVVEKRNDVIYSSGTRICETTQFPFPPSVDHVCVMSPHTSSRWALQSRWNLETSDTGWIVSNVIQIKTVAVCMELCKHKKHYKKKAIEKEELKTSRHLFAYTENLSFCAYAPHDELLARSIRTESNREKRERSTVAATARQSLQTQHALRPQESLKKLVSFQNEKGKKKKKKLMGLFLCDQ